MKSEYIKYILYFVLAALVVVGIQLFFPNPINWNKNYNTRSKDPYGLYVFNKELPKLLSNQQLHKSSLTPYEYFDYNKVPADSSTTYLLVQNPYALDQVSVSKLMEKVANGADLVVASERFYYSYSLLLDTLQINTYDTKAKQLFFVDKSAKKDTIHLRDDYHSIFTISKPEKYTAIAKLNNNLSFISTKFGKGNVYLSTTPILLTNYYLLNKNQHSAQFTERFASYLKKDHIVWFDQNYDTDQIANNDSLFKIIFKYPSLRYAWYTLIIGLILYLIFYGKRRQRIVPIIEPVKNTTVEYVETVGNLYYQEKNHTQLLDKQIKYALHYIRTEYKILTQHLNDDFINKLQQKTMANEDDIKNFVHFINHFNTNYNYTQQDLIHFNLLLEKLHIHYGKSGK